MSDKKTGLDLLREPFPANQISKLPKPTRAQTDEVKRDFKTGIRCGECGGWHHPKVVHLDYVGHAALTDRLLDCDPEWNWEFVSAQENGLPVIDNDGGFWIKLTVSGMTRLGYGDAQGKTGGNAMKERIGDALRNAAMRFGAALDLWHKGDLHIEDADESAPAPAEKPATEQQFISKEQEQQIRKALLVTGRSEIELCQKIGFESILKIPTASFETIHTSLKNIAIKEGEQK